MEARDVAGCPEIGDKAFGKPTEEVMEEGARLLEKEKTPDLLKLYRIKEQISQHLMEYNTVINSAAAEKIPDQNRNEKVLEGSMEELERDLEEMRVSYQNKTLTLQRIQITDALRTKMKNEDDDSEFIRDTIKHIIMLSTAILKSKQQSHELEEKLNEVKKSRLELKRAGECKLAQIYDMKRKQKEDLENMEVGKMLKNVRENLQKEIQMTTLIQNIFQITDSPQFMTNIYDWLQPVMRPRFVLFYHVSSKNALSGGWIQIYDCIIRLTHMIWTYDYMIYLMIKMIVKLSPN